MAITKLLALRKYTGQKKVLRVETTKFHEDNVISHPPRIKMELTSGTRDINVILVLMNDAFMLKKDLMVIKIDDNQVIIQLSGIFEVNIVFLLNTCTLDIVKSRWRHTKEKLRVHRTYKI